MKKIYSSLLLSTLVVFSACSSSKSSKRIAIWDTVPQSEQVTEEVAEVKEKSKEDKYAELEKLAATASQNSLRASNEPATMTNTASGKDALSKEYDTPSINRMFHSGDYTPESGYSGSVHKYNVVIAALSVNTNANRLKGQLIADNEKVFTARSQNGLTYLVLGTYDNKDEAVKRSSGFLNKYMSRYNRSDLYNKYRIPFVDIWVLVKNSGFANASMQSTSGYSSSAYRPAGVSPSSSLLPATAAKLSSIDGLDEQAIAEVFNDGKIVTEIKDTKKYNVIVASTPHVERAVRTKELLNKDNELAFIGIDANGMHYVVVGSYETAEQAYNGRANFMSKYLNQYSKQQLMSKYGSNFVDSWILVQ